MSLHDKTDRLFDDNLRAFGTSMNPPGVPGSDVRDSCESALTSASEGSTMRHRPRGMRTVWSTLAAAASIVLLASLMFPWGSGPQVQAATILAKLDQQIQNPTQIEVTLESIAVDNAVINAHLQIGETGIAGDVRATVTEAEGTIEVDVSLGIGEQTGWILIRKLVIPDPRVHAILAMLLPEGTETLLMLPEEIAQENIGGQLSEALTELKDVSRFVQTLADLADEDPNSGATVTEQYDGTVLLTIPITDAKSLENLFGLVARAIQKEEGGDDADIDIDEGDFDDDARGLFGSTITIVYDPASDLVRSFSVTGFGEQNGTISIVLSDDPIAEDLLDSSRVTGPNTRTLDLGALESMFKAFGNSD